MASHGKRTIRIFTLGHSDRTLDRFIGLLAQSSIRAVADVRSNPASARFPHFERRSLAAALDEYGISYRWFRALGGFQPKTDTDGLHSALNEAFRPYASAMSTPPFASAMEELVGLGASTSTAIICAERDPKQCHRSLLADKLTLAGVRVVHILDENTAVPHELHPDAAEEASGELVYREKQLDLL